jgi:hypothetical protein
MSKNQVKVVMLVGACGLAAGIGSRASAQPFVINVSGATLQQNFIIAPASTNEFLEINGVAGSQQLAPAGLPSGTGQPYNANQYWIVQYRSTGSGNGLKELVNYGRTYVTTGDDVTYCPAPPPTPFGVPLGARVASAAWMNGVQYIANNCPASAIFNTNHAGGAPVRSVLLDEMCNGGQPVFGNHQAAPFARFPDTSPDSGIQVDVAPLDVPVTWFVQQDGEADPLRTPVTAGYGTNAVLALNADGTVYEDDSGNHQSNRLEELGSANLNSIAPDCDTLYTVPIAFAPVAYLTNFGTGMEQIDKTNMRHLSATGRTRSGENLVLVTRDSGSGTRNSAMNSVCLDPSWGIGENIGPINAAVSQSSIGPSYLPSNKNGSGDMERAVINTRLAIG